MPSTDTAAAAKREIFKNDAIKLFKSNFWEKMSNKEIVEFQLFTKRLCMPFEVFHKAVEEVLGRSVYTHEFAFGGIKKEFLGEREVPTFQEILNLIPEQKRILIISHRQKSLTPSK